MNKFLLMLLFFSQSTYATTYFDETKIQEPFFDSNEENLESTICKTREHLRWDICSTLYADNSEKERSVQFFNWGPNRIVPKSGFGMGRSFEFSFEGLARSDMQLLVWDTPDENESHGHLRIMMFFPRKVMPAIRYISDSKTDQMIVTLPNLEEVIFNGKTREIIDGVLTEGSIKQNENGYALNPDLKYTGKGVVISADAIADYPVGFRNTKRTATISKKGFNDCLVRVNELWYTDNKKGGNVFFNKKYVTDEAFDKFLNKRCGFSIY